MEVEAQNALPATLKGCLFIDITMQFRCTSGQALGLNSDIFNG
jgi:hypothetical protein